jgi:hypothetical protein
MPAAMKLPITHTEQSLGERLSQLSEIYAGITGHIYHSNVEPHHKTLYGLAYPTALGFAMLAWFNAPWYGYAFFAGVMVLYALVITKSNGGSKTGRKSQIKPRVE